MYNYFYEHPHIAQTIIYVVAFFVLVGLVFVLGKSKRFRHISIGKSGLILEADEKEKEKERLWQSGNLEHLVRDLIQKLDMELMEFAIEQTSKVRKSFLIQLNKEIHYFYVTSTVSSLLYFPLLIAAIRNNFKIVLRPDNIKFYIERILKDLLYEYEELKLMHGNNDSKGAKEKYVENLPEWEVLEQSIQSILEHEWAIPIKQKNIDVCKKKIAVYRSFITSFENIGDFIKVNVMNACIEKNESYIKGFFKAPEIRQN